MDLNTIWKFTVIKYKNKCVCGGVCVCMYVCVWVCVCAGMTKKITLILLNDMPADVWNESGLFSFASGGVEGLCYRDDRECLVLKSLASLWLTQTCII